MKRLLINSLLGCMLISNVQANLLDVFNHFPDLPATSINEIMAGITIGAVTPVLAGSIGGTAIKGLELILQKNNTEQATIQNTLKYKALICTRFFGYYLGIPIGVAYLTLSNDKFAQFARNHPLGIVTTGLSLLATGNFAEQIKKSLD